MATSICWNGNSWDFICGKTIKLWYNDYGDERFAKAFRWMVEPRQNGIKFL